MRGRSAGNPTTMKSALEAWGALQQRHDGQFDGSHAHAMHQVPRLRTKVVRGFRERVQDWTEARIINTARTPIAKAI